MATANRPQARTARGQPAGYLPPVCARRSAAPRRCVSWMLALGLTVSPVPAEAQSSRPAAWGVADVLCEVADSRIAEASGIVASRRHPGHYYVQNDSGNAAEVFVLDRKGRVRAVLTLKGTRNVDWEDIAIAPGAAADRFDVVIADIGDNKARRADIRLYRFPEPDLPAQLGAGVLVEPRVFTLRYADGPRNAEALIVDPTSGSGYILTKREDATSEVYEVPTPWSSAAEIVLRRVATIKLPGGASPATIITAADIAPERSRIVVRTYGCGWEWLIAPAGDIPEALAKTPARLDLAAEAQGEAVAFGADGRSLLTISEGSPTRVHESLLESHARP